MKITENYSESYRTTETTQEKADRENWETCKRIAEEIERIENGNCYRCPTCCEIIEWDNDQYNDDETTYICPCCNHAVDESELEPFTLYDYFNDVFDIEYRIGSDKEFRSVQIMVACGGPNIYVDTAEKAVLLYWWADKARYYISDEAAEAINQIFEEYYNC